VRAAAVAVASLAAAAGLAACGSGAGATTATDPAALLRRAEATIDATNALHFSLQSQHAGGAGATILSGEGDAARPDALAGTFTVAVSNLPVTVKVIGVGGRFYVEAPFTSSYALTDPATYGIGDPAQLIDADHGLSSILPELTGLRSLGRTRVGAEVADEITGTLPGDRLPVLPDVAPAQPVTVTVDVVTPSDQVRRMVLTGPFTSPTPSTYTVTLTDYGEAVHITAPPT
jgi:hypothetical protein